MIRVWKKILRVIIPSRFSHEVKWIFAECFDQLRELNALIFTCYLSRDYGEKHFYYEKKLHEKRADFLYALLQARKLLIGAKYIVYLELLADIEKLFEITLALNTLLYRVSDHTTFEVASAEFLSTATTIENNLKALSAKLSNKKTMYSVTSLAEDIQAFAEVNQSALQVVAREPIVFLLFINDLENLNVLFLEITERLDGL